MLCNATDRFSRPAHGSQGTTDRSFRYPSPEFLKEEVCHLASIQVRLFDQRVQRAFRIVDVMQLRRPMRAVLRGGDSDCCLSRRILWTVRVVHEAFKAISRVTNPCASKVSTRIRCVASSCGAMAVAGTKALTLVGIEEEEERQGMAKLAKGIFLDGSAAGGTARSSFVRHDSLGTVRPLEG